MRTMPRLVSLAVILTLIIVLGVTFFRVVAPFLMPLFLACMTAIICQPVFRYFLRRSNGRVGVASGLTTASILATFMVPLTLGIFLAALQLYTFAHTVGDQGAFVHLVQKVQAQAESGSTPLFEQLVDFGNQFLPEDQRDSPEEVAHSLQLKLRESLTTVGARTLGLAAGRTLDVLAEAAVTALSAAIAVFIYAIALFYFLSDGQTLLKAAEKLIPVHVDYQRQLLHEFAKVVRSIVVATFMAAVAQGIATVLALGLFGFPHLFVLFVLATLSALIPVAGTWVVWVPCAIELFFSGHPVQAVFLSLYGAIFVGFLDNVVRTYVLNAETQLHPLLAFLSVLGGLQVMGLWGVFIGPIVASCLHALVKIFNHELFELSRERRSLLVEQQSGSQESDSDSSHPKGSPTKSQQPGKSAKGSAKKSKQSPSS